MGEAVEEFEICVSSELANLGQIAEFVSERARLSGMNDDRVFDVQMAVDEACTNTVQHAYDGRADGEIQVCCYVDRDDFVVRIRDFGIPFDPSKVPEPDISAPLEERAVGGLGWYFIRKLMDQVEIRPTAEGNELTMRKRRESGTS